MSNERCLECIMTAAGGVNNGVYETRKEKSKYAVAVDMAQSVHISKYYINFCNKEEG